MARVQKSEAPRLYSLAQLWSEHANRFDEQADELVQQQFLGICDDLREITEKLRAVAARARRIAGEAE